MNKLKLDLDQLTVDSFNTDASGIARRGTVQAHSDRCPATFAGQNTCDSCENTCDGWGATCFAGCTAGCTGGYSCGGTCGGSCVDPTCNTCFTRCDQESCGVIQCP